MPFRQEDKNINGKQKRQVILFFERTAQLIKIIRRNKKRAAKSFKAPPSVIMLTEVYAPEKNQHNAANINESVSGGLEKTSPLI